VLKRVAGLALLVMLLVSAVARAEFDYFAANRDMIRNGVQAVLMCNGLFTSDRSLEQVKAQELRYITGKYQRAPSDAFRIYSKDKAVRVGGEQEGMAITAAFREGLGCVVMSPEQSLDDISELPSNKFAINRKTNEDLLWPMGDVVGKQALDSSISQSALLAAADWAFERDTDEQDTLSLLVVHKGQIILERYAEGVTAQTKTRTWSTAKSIASTLIGMLVDQEKMALDEPLDLPWLPSVTAQEQDPRDAVTLRHLLRMSSGLEPIDSFNMEYATGSGLAYWAGSSSAVGALQRGLIRQPGSFWDYENYDTLLAVMAMRAELGDDYHAFPYRELLHKLGMNNTLLSTDRFGDFILSSQVYTNARDLARFGLLYLQGGQWNGEQLISQDWIEFSRTPAPASSVRHFDYGAQWWLVPNNRKDVPSDAYSTAGNRGQYVVVVPSHDLVIVRRGLDWGQQGFNRWDLTREVLKAFPVPE